MLNENVGLTIDGILLEDLTAIFQDFEFPEMTNDAQHQVIHAKLKDNQQNVVIKVLPFDRWNEDRIFAELQAAKSLDVLFVARPMAIRRVKDRIAVVYEYFEGETLSSFVDRYGSSSEVEAIEIVRQASIGLHAIYQHGLCHGGLKPKKLVLIAQGRIRILDVGLYQHFASTRQHECDFAAPEHGFNQDIRSDIYSLGLVLVYLLLGQSTPGLEFANDKWRIKDKPVSTKLQTQLDELAPGLQAVLRIALAKDGEARYKTPKTFGNALGNACQNLNGSSRNLITGISRSFEPDYGERYSSIKKALIGAMILSLIPLAPFFVALIVAFQYPPVINEQDNYFIAAKVIHTLPGREDKWWVEDESTYRLLPPVRADLAEILESKYGMSHSQDLFGASQSAPNTKRPISFETLRRQIISAAQKNKCDPTAESNEFENLESLENYNEIVEIIDPRRIKSAGYSARMHWAINVIPIDESPTNWHLRAVLSHLLAKHKRHVPNKEHESATHSNSDPQTHTEFSDQVLWESAIRHYETALGHYEWHQVELKALCHSDLGQLLADYGKDDFKAANHYRLARELVTKSTRDAAIHHFVVHCLCREGNLFRKNGEWKQAEERLITACTMTETESGLPEAPGLRAYVLERYAWYLMDRWRVSEAQLQFVAANELRKNLNEDEMSSGYRHHNQLRMLHNRHGIAMALRYGGLEDRAAVAYKEVISDLRTKRPGKDNYNRRLEFESQLQNSLVRRADCALFGDPDKIKVRASDALDEAIGSLRRHQLLYTIKPEELAELQFKKAIAQMIEGNHKAARESYDVAHQILTMEPSKSMPPQLSFVDAITEACTNRGNECQSGMHLFNTIESEFRKLNDKNLISRDELDLLLLAAGQLNDHVDPLLRAQLLRRLAELPTTGNHTADSQNLYFVRYLEEAFNSAEKIECPDEQELYFIEELRAALDYRQLSTAESIETSTGDSGG